MNKAPEGNQPGSKEHLASTHTPGPWEIAAKLTASENHKGYFIRAPKKNGAGKWALAEVQPADEDGKEGGANARLIAAAPDLLAFAESVVELFAVAYPKANLQLDMDKASLLNAAREVIAKAKL